MRYDERVVLTRERSCVYGVLLGDAWGERVNLEELNVDGKIILKWFVRNSVRRAWGRFIWLDVRETNVGFL